MQKDFLNKIEKSSNFEIKAIDTEKRTIVAYGSAFGNKDSHGDIILQGAFKESIGKSILFLNSHNRFDTTDVLGVISKLEEDENGLLFEVTIANTTKGNDILELYKAGVPLQHSIGGYYGENGIKYDENIGAWLVSKFDLHEISVVPFGSNSNTPVVEVKDNTVINTLRLKIEELSTEVEALKNKKEEIDTKQTLKKHLNL